MWYNVKFKKTAIERELGKMTLINIPNSKFSFWVATKLIKNINDKEISVGINEEFEYKLIKPFYEEVVKGNQLIYFVGYKKSKHEVNRSFG